MLFSNLGFVDTLLAFGYIVDVAAEWARKTGAVHKGLSVIWKKIMGQTTNGTMVEIDLTETMMEELRKRLEGILDRVKFEVRTSRTVNRRKSADNFGSVSIEYRQDPARRLTPSELGKYYERIKHGLGTSTWVEVVPGDDALGEMDALTAELRSVLSAFVEPTEDIVGHGLHWVRASGTRMTKGFASGLYGSETVSKVKDLAEVLIVAGGCLGADAVIRMLLQWLEGEPLRYCTCTLLPGVDVNGKLQRDGVCVERLADSSEELPASLPVENSQAVHEFLQGVVMSVDTCAGPALFLPEGRENRKQKIRPWCVLGDGDRLLDSFCESLSLAVNYCVQRKWVWMDYGDLTAFGFGRSGLSGGPGYAGDIWSKVLLDQKVLDRAWEIHSKRRQGSKKTRRLETSIDRWMKSKDKSSRLSDRFIELRIALEALYLDGDRAELRFRLATNGAWDLGATPSQREAYHKVLRSTYDVASQAVHTGHVKEEESNMILLEKGQNACRKGILKRLGRNGAPDWLRLVLGHKDKTPTD